MADLAGMRIGFVGLGLMGRPMARNLHAAGARLAIHNRSRGPVEELSAEGMMPAATPRAAAERSEIVIVMVSDTPAVEQVLSGPDGIVAGLAPGRIVVDMGTTAVEATRRFGGMVRAMGADFLDAPVSGGAVGAEAGTLSIMVGGGEDAFARAKPVFDVLGRNITHVGDIGAGQVAKTANQVIVGLTIEAVAEALTLARAAGVDPARVRAALTGGFADSRILELHGQRMIEGNFAPGGKVRTQRKDIAQALDLARALDLDLPALALNLDLWDRMIERGWDELDHSALIKLLDPSER